MHVVGLLFFFLPEQCGPSWSRCIPQHWGPWQEGSQGDYCRRSPWRRNRACTSSGLLKHRHTLSNKNIQLNLEEVTLDQTSMTVMMGITWLDKKKKTGTDYFCKADLMEVNFKCQQTMSTYPIWTLLLNIIKMLYFNNISDILALPIA